MELSSFIYYKPLQTLYPYLTSYMHTQADERMNAALGWMCLMSLLTAKYLNLPLLNPMVFRGSQSLVIDGRVDRPAMKPGQNGVSGGAHRGRNLISVPIASSPSGNPASGKAHGRGRAMCMWVYHLSVL